MCIRDSPKGDAFASRNKYALEIDYEAQPPFFKVSDTHYAATWLLDEYAPEVEAPKIVKQRIINSLKKNSSNKPNYTLEKNSILNHLGSCMPGPPFGPSWVMTTQSPELTFPPRMPSHASS